MRNDKYPTLLHEMLKMETGLRVPFNDRLWSITKDGILYSVKASDGTSLYTDSLAACNFIFFRLACLKLPRLTETQISEMKALLLVGLKWIAKDKHGDIFFYTEKPRKRPDDGIWDIPIGEGELLEARPKMEVRSLVSWDDREPLNIENALEIAGA
jgi:hypothetical protein